MSTYCMLGGHSGFKIFTTTPCRCIISFSQNQGSEGLSNLLRVTQLVRDGTRLCLHSFHFTPICLKGPSSEKPALPPVAPLAGLRCHHALRLIYHLPESRASPVSPIRLCLLWGQGQELPVLSPHPCTANPHSYVSDEGMTIWKDRTRELE